MVKGVNCILLDTVGFVSNLPYVGGGVFVGWEREGEEGSELRFS
jgi:hypothetical protein